MSQIVKCDTCSLEIHIEKIVDTEARLREVQLKDSDMKHWNCFNCGWNMSLVSSPVELIRQQLRSYLSIIYGPKNEYTNPLDSLSPVPESNSTNPAARSDAVDKATAFHEHLDQCVQCSENPMALCSVGSKLLTASVI